jgi:hypothetical protein
MACNYRLAGPAITKPLVSIVTDASSVILHIDQAKHVQATAA